MLDLFPGIITNPVQEASLPAIDCAAKRKQKCFKPYKERVYNESYN
jgi:hypothetical protein